MGHAELVAVGSSWGGLRALAVVLGGLPANLDAAVVLAQHRAVTSTGALTAILQRDSALPVVEIEDKAPIERARVYLAPADYHVVVERGHFALSVTEPVLFSRPSVDVLFETAALAYGSRVIAVVLTGASADGAAGLRAVKDAGGVTVVQDPASAEAAVMPDAAISSGAADKVLPLADIAAFLVELCGTTT